MSSIKRGSCDIIEGGSKKGRRVGVVVVVVVVVGVTADVRSIKRGSCDTHS